MRAEQGTFIYADRNKPARDPVIPIAPEINIRCLKRLVKSSAINCGSESIDIKSIIPTSFIVRTMQSATRTVIIVVINVTGSPDTFAKSLSKATATIFLKNNAKNKASTSV